MTRLLPLRVAALASFVALVALPAQAQVRTSGVDVEHLQLDPAGRGSLLIGTGELLRPGAVRGSVLLQYGVNPLGELAPGLGGPVGLDRRSTVHTGLAVGLSERFELGLSVPVIVYQRSGTSGFSPERRGLGTPMVRLRTSLLSPEALGQDRRAFAAADLGVGLPVGREEALGNGGLVVLPRILFGGQVGAVLLGGELYGLLRDEASLDVVSAGSGASIGPQLGLGMMMTSASEGIRPEFSIRVFGDTRRDVVGAEGLVGLRIPVVGGLELQAAAGPGLGGEPSTPVFRALAGLSFATAGTPPRPRCTQGQPHAPADCPDLDLDEDGIPNRADRCPEQPEDKNGFEDKDGCPDDTRDTDGDGLSDSTDACPTEAGVRENRGCPDGDQDGDTVVDRLDKCPTEKGTPEEGGCPVRDQDGDGIPDRVDACPTEKGTAEENGCPEKDTDQDGVADRRDNCINEPGPAENQGCPASQKQLVVITREKLEIRDKVYFATNKATLLPRSRPLLDQVAKVLNEHPEIKRVRVEGHTDSRGSAARNERLSADRAVSVRRYLVGRGVAADRLLSEGFGPRRPIAPNNTALGREQNRRVEFVVLDDEDPAYPGAVPVPLVPAQSGEGETEAPAQE